MWYNTWHIPSLWYTIWYILWYTIWYIVINHLKMWYTTWHTPTVVYYRTVQQTNYGHTMWYTTWHNMIYLPSHRALSLYHLKSIFYLNIQKKHNTALYTSISPNLSLYYPPPLHTTQIWTHLYTSTPTERIHGLTDRALDHRSLPPVFEFRAGHIWRVFHLWLRFITPGGRWKVLKNMIIMINTEVSNDHDWYCYT